MYQTQSPRMQMSGSDSMMEFGKGRPEANNESGFSSFVKWLELKNYQYEVTFSLYMLTRREKIIFNLILIILSSMLVIAASLYLPNHVSIIYNRVLYYVEGSTVSATIVDAVKTTRAALAYPASTVAAQQVTEQVLKEL